MLLSCKQATNLWQKKKTSVKFAACKAQPDVHPTGDNKIPESSKNQTSTISDSVHALKSFVNTCRTQQVAIARTTEKQLKVQLSEMRKRLRSCCLIVLIRFWSFFSRTSIRLSAAAFNISISPPNYSVMFRTHYLTAEQHGPVNAIWESVNALIYSRLDNNFNLVFSLTNSNCSGILN